MRFQLGLSILLVFALGFVHFSPISSHNYEDVSTPEAEAGINQSSSSSIEETSSVQQQAENSVPKVESPPNNEETNSQIKRTDPVGMPSNPAQLDPSPETGSQSSQEDQPGISPPINEPISAAEIPSPSSPDSSQGSQARGLSSSPKGQDNSQQVPDVPRENLPIIIENNQPVKLPTSTDQQNQSQQQQTGADTSLQTSSGDLPSSTSRTFTEGWTNCVGAQSNKYGTCKNDVECNKSKGRADGSCMGGFGVCCIMALSCGDKSIENNTFYANPDFPEPSWEARLCEVEVKKKHKKVLQVMIEFEEFELAPPNQDGECITDVFQVKLASNRPSPYSLLRICGQNTGQHMYLDVSQIEEPLVLSVATSGGGFPRRWSIRIVQMDEKNFLLAPPGCLQYYTDTVGHFRSFNLGKNLKNLYYAICFRIDNGYSGIRFTANFFGLHGPFCRRRLGQQNSGGHLTPGRIEAHPHHLVIPPLGYAPPPPKPIAHHIAPYPSQTPVPQYGQITGSPNQRLKRMAYIEAGERVPRTLHEHEKLEEKEFAKHHEHHQHTPPPGYGYSPTYGPTHGPSYGPTPVVHGPYGSPPGYGPYPYDGKRLDIKEKWDDKLGKNPHGYEESKGAWWKDPFGWTTKAERKDIKHEGYGHNYGSSHYEPGYGPQGYGHHGYGSGYGHGGYHHKEIDKFGQKFEHLEHKHEHNHHGKEHEETKGGWWFWGKKEDKNNKKDKFYVHHEALFPMVRIPEMPHCEPRYCGANDVITFPPSGDSISEMCGNRFNRGRGPKIISGSPLVVYVSNRGHNRGAGFDMNYEQVFYIPRPY